LRELQSTLTTPKKETPEPEERLKVVVKIDTHYGRNSIKMEHEIISKLEEHDFMKFCAARIPVSEALTEHVLFRGLLCV